VSTFFVLIRYLGLYGFITDILLSSSFLPGPANSATLCRVIGVTNLWAIFAFICVADLVMILRLWAMYNRSKLILGILLTFYIAEIVPSTIGCIVYTIPQNLSVTVAHVLDLSFCSGGPLSPSWKKVSSITQLIHAAVMCMLVIIQFIRQSVQMYKATKQWRLNQFVNLLVMEGVLYFFAILAWNLVNALYAWGVITVAGQQAIPITLLEFVPISTLTPRFILNMRELYARNVRGERGSGIDSGFGLSTVSGRLASRSTIVFVDGGRNEGLEHGEEIPMEVRSEVGNSK